MASTKPKRNKPKKSKLSMVHKALASFDTNAESLEFQISSGSTEVKTLLGSLLSFISLGIVLAYAYLKFLIMKERDDTSIMISDKENWFDDNDILSDSLGFNVAFGLTYFDGSPEFLEDPDYGTLQARYREWGLNEDGDSIK